MIKQNEKTIKTAIRKLIKECEKHGFMLSSFNDGGGIEQCDNNTPIDTFTGAEEVCLRFRRNDNQGLSFYLVFDYSDTIDCLIADGASAEHNIPLWNEIAETIQSQ